MFDAAKLAEGKALTGCHWVGGEELSELLWGADTEYDSGETRVVSVRRLGPAPEPTITLANMRPPLTGAPRQPGYNVDALDIEAGIQCARGLNMTELHLMVVGYGLQRWARGEEAPADEMIVRASMASRCPCTWRMILATAQGSRRIQVGGWLGVSEVLPSSKQSSAACEESTFQAMYRSQGNPCLLVGGEPRDRVVRAAT